MKMSVGSLFSGIGMNVGASGVDTTYLPIYRQGGFLYRANPFRQLENIVAN